MFCTKCGKEIIEGAAFCSNCGAKVIAFEKPAYEVAPVVEEPVAQPVVEAPVVPAYAVAPTVEAPAVEEAPVTPAYEVAPVVEAPVVEEAPVAPAYEVPVQPVAEEPVYVPPVQPEVAQPVYTQPAAPAEPVYVPNYQQTDEVKNNGRVGFGDAINLLIKNIVNFSGKASRSEFWFGYLFIGIVSLACMVIPYIGYLLSLGTVLPTLSLSVRRIRDTGREWNYIFMGLIPIVGTILLIITFCKETDYYNDCSLSKR
ncbi:MAG: DUF805 domain-containing protein [Ruminococcaceae bacterium]|nr:DUF805 domain-containing protein [Oscillospiraceae bacterium]